MKTVSLTRVLNAAKRGSVLFVNREGGVSSSKDVDTIFAQIPLRKIIGVYDDRITKEHLEDDLSYAGFLAE